MYIIIYIHMYIIIYIYHLIITYNNQYIIHMRIWSFSTCVPIKDPVKFYGTPWKIMFKLTQFFEVHEIPIFHGKISI